MEFNFVLRFGLFYRVILYVLCIHHSKIIVVVVVVIYCSKAKNLLDVFILKTYLFCFKHRNFGLIPILSKVMCLVQFVYIRL